MQRAEGASAFALLGLALIKLSTLVVVTASSSRLAKNGELVVATA